MWLFKVDIRALGHNLCWVNGFMAGIVMRFNMVHDDRLFNARILIQLQQVIPHSRIVNNALFIGFKVPKIDRIKTH